MESALTSLITSADPATRDRSLDELAAAASFDALLSECEALDGFRRQSDNLYERVRALFFLYAIHRFHLPAHFERGADASSANVRRTPSSGEAGEGGRGVRQTTTDEGVRATPIPFHGYTHLLERRFEEAIEIFLRKQKDDGPSDALSSALASAYHRLAFQTLADQVRRSVRGVRGNQWMFRMGHPKDQPLRLRPELLRAGADGSYPILRECTPVRMDLTHSAWSDIFFLGMDFPEGARVLNISVDLSVHGRDAGPQPPVSAWLRVIEEPVLRLVSVDLGATAEISSLAEVFDFAKDYLGLLKAAVIASGIVPPGIEGSGQSLADLLAQMLGPGRGLELVSSVNDIPKGSRLAVSTNLLAALIAVCMRATRQAESLTGPLREEERRLVLARALLGEWLGGSGGGWQDSGGVWPGIKLIEGVAAQAGDAEHGVSRGRLMPRHHVFSRDEISEAAREKLQQSLVLVHGGMAQNVGPILEMVTEKYLLRSGAEWRGRQEALGVLDEILAALREENIARVGAATTRNFAGPIQTIIPWASTHYTERLIDQVRAEFGKDFWGFWMLGGMSGGGMGFIFAPQRKTEAQARLAAIMSATRRELAASLPFAMEPVVYDFKINEHGTFADLLAGDAALMPKGYYLLTAPALIRLDRRQLSALRRAELDKFAAACRTRPELGGVVQELFDHLLPRTKAEHGEGQGTLEELLAENGFDREAHERIRADLRAGRIGLAQNRLPANAAIEDVRAEDVAQESSAVQVSVAQESSAVQVSVAQASLPAAVWQASLLAEPPQPERFRAFDPTAPISMKSRRLPHWRQAGATYFVTFRLFDSLPDAALADWHSDRDAWLRTHPRPWSPPIAAEYYRLFHQSIEEQLDKGLGSCVLAERAPADIVENALRHFDGERYVLGSYVVMPNHVHVLVTPQSEEELSRTLHSWKSYSAQRINQLLGRSGQLWQRESFDHIVRHEHELRAIEGYIAENPRNAGLTAGKFRLGCGGDGGLQAGMPAELPQAGSLRHAAVEDSQAGSVRHAALFARGEFAWRGLPACGSSAGFQPAVQAGMPAELPQAGSLRHGGSPRHARGLAALRAGEAAVVTLAAGAASRWTQGAGVVKSLHPFCKLAGRHRTFLETHLAKSRRISRLAGTAVPHIFTTSYLTHDPIAAILAARGNYSYPGPLLLSRGKSVGLRFVPTARDLRFAWEEMPQQVLDEQQQKVRDSLRTALIGWAAGAGEATDYTDNLPLQCMHPVGHFYEIPNLLRNGTLTRLLGERPQLRTLMLHNIDTLGADLDPALLGHHLESGATLTFEVITRRLEDRGGGLARVDGRPRLVEGLAMPREELEFGLTYYNTLTTWIDIDGLLAALGLTRADILAGEIDAAPREKILAAIRALAAKVPTYITLKDVKKRWGHGQEDIFPVAQFEKLWGDLSALPEIDSKFVRVPRLRGQQLKEPAQLDGWLRDGSAAHVESLCEWE